MFRLLLSFFGWFAAFFRSQLNLGLELVVMRYQVSALKRKNPRPRLSARGSRPHPMKTTGGENNEAGRSEWPPVRLAAGKPCRMLAINLIDLTNNLASA
jgi:hypothetical protein